MTPTSEPTLLPVRYPDNSAAVPSGFGYGGGALRIKPDQVCSKILNETLLFWKEFH